MSDLLEQKLKTNFTFQNFLPRVPKNLLNIKELKYGTRSQLKLNNLHSTNLTLSTKRNYLKAIVNLPHLYYHYNALASNFLKNNVASSDCNFRVAA